MTEINIPDTMTNLYRFLFFIKSEDVRLKGTHSERIVNIKANNITEAIISANKYCNKIINYKMFINSNQT